jgi:hypothetical protein
MAKAKAKAKKQSKWPGRLFKYGTALVIGGVTGYLVRPFVDESTASLRDRIPFFDSKASADTSMPESMITETENFRDGNAPSLLGFGSNKHSVIYSDDTIKGLKAFVSYDKNQVELSRIGVSQDSVQFALPDIRDGGFDIFAVDRDNNKSERTTRYARAGRVYETP